MKMKATFLYGLVLATAIGCLLGPASRADAALLVENFEGHSGTGETTPLVGWTLLDTQGTFNASYVSAVGSGGTGIAGSVSSIDFVSADLPGGYLVPLPVREFRLRNPIYATFL